jgi:hypothetical protein
MGSPGRHVYASPGKAVFLRITLIKTAPETPRRRLSRGGDVYRIRRYEEISPRLCNYLNTCLACKKQQRAIRIL